MTWLEAIVLGFVQGLTEFLPISSSGHLRIVSEVFFDQDAGAAFTAVTQLGTEAAVLIYFARDIGRLIATWFRGFRSAEVRATQDYRMAWIVIIGTIPIGVLGLIFEEQIQTGGRNLWLIGSTLIVFGVLLGLAESAGRQVRPVERLTLRDGVLMGLGQAMALIPGVSRSGATTTTGLFLGLKREAAVRVGFLLAIPSVVAAGLFQLPDVFATDGPGLQPSVPQMVVATVIAFVVGYACVAWLLRFVARHSVYVFVVYRIVLGALVLSLLAGGVISAT